METNEISVVEQSTIVNLIGEEGLTVYDKSVQMLGGRVAKAIDPLVQQLDQLQHYAGVKYDENEKNEEVYKAGWKEIRAFNSATKKTKSALKKDILNAGRALDSLEKHLLEESSSLMETLEMNFKPYLDEKERKKKEREAKKEAERQKALAEAQAEADAAKEKMESMKAYEMMRDTIDSQREMVISFVNRPAVPSSHAEAKRIKRDLDMAPDLSGYVASDPLLAKTASKIGVNDIIRLDEKYKEIRAFNMAQVEKYLDDKKYLVEQNLTETKAKIETAPAENIPVSPEALRQEINRTFNDAKFHIILLKNQKSKWQYLSDSDRSKAEAICSIF